MNLSDWILAHGESLQLALFFGLLALLVAGERLVPRRPGPLDRRTRWPTNLLLTGLNVVVLSALPVSFLGAAFWAQARGWGLLNAVSVPLVASVALTLLVRGFVSFFTHRLMHGVPWLWRLHRVHHLDTELDVTTTVRFHPLEFVAGVLPGLPIVVAFGLVPWVLVVYELLDVAVTLWSHSNLRVPARLDRALRYVIVTPDLHRIHHSTWQPPSPAGRRSTSPT